MTPPLADDPTLSFGETGASNPSATPPAPRLWGEFRLIERVGQGGFGEVYRAWDPHLEREIALKLLLPGAVSDEKQYENMLREARALASVRHPNVVAVYGIDRHDGRVGFWTDFVRGRTLAAVVREGGPLGYREAALVGLDVTRALCAVHLAGILHRDIKPENVMREEGGRILLMDFGLSTGAMRTGGLAGTPNYMAPELFRGNPATVHTDVYAMGVLLYHLVTGAHPVRLGGLTLDEVEGAMQRRKPLLDARPDLPEAFVRVVSQASELQPERRFSSSGQLGEALGDLLGGPRSGERTVAPPPPSKWKRGSKVGLAVAGVTMIIALGVSYASRHSAHSAPTEGLSAAAAGGSAESIERYNRAQDVLLKSYQYANREEAVRQFQSLLADDPGFALAHAGLGSAYLIQFRSLHDPKLLDAAKSETKRAIALAPNLAPPYVTLARIAAMEGQTSLGMQHAQRALSLEPRNADAQRALAEVYEAEGRRPEAIAALEKAEDLAPEDWRWPLALGVSYLAAGKLPEAQAEFSKSAKLADDNATAYLNLGIVDRRLDKLEDAKTNLQHALKIEATARTYIELGSTLDAEGKYADALPMYRAATAKNPGDERAWSGIAGDDLMLPAHHAEAIPAYRKAIEVAEAARARQPKDVDLLSVLAYYYAQVGERDRSRILVRQALALAGEDPGVLYGAGSTWELLGDRDKAMQAISRALALGYSRRDFEREPLLAALRADPAFPRIAKVAQSEKSTNPEFR